MLTAIEIRWQRLPHGKGPTWSGAARMGQNEPLGMLS